MNWIQKIAARLLKITPATNREITVKEPLTFEANVIKNKMWYRGDAVELEQFFRAIAKYDVEKSRFWASRSEQPVRKVHSGIVQIVVDRLTDIVLSDMNDVDFGEESEEKKPLLDMWNLIAKDNTLNEVLNEAISGALSTGDGAFKISIDPNIEYPILEFYTGDNVDYIRKRRRLHEVIFYTKYPYEGKEYILQEVYGKGYVNYKLFKDDKEIAINSIPDTKDLQDVTMSHPILMAVPLMFFTSNKWRGRGKALFDSKTEVLDSLDEVISQWADAVRLGRVKRYIPEDLCPRDPETGVILPPNPFDNQFTLIGASMGENDKSKIDVSQPVISYEAYANSYCNYLDMVLQGIISPATLGIDLKKTDNAESQREKEKITLHTRNKITDTLQEVLPTLVMTVMQVYDLMQSKVPAEYEPAVKFGEYGAPGFENVVETVGKAKNYGVMSIETCIEELYGDTWTEDQKKEEIMRIKLEQGIGAEPTEPTDDIDGDGGDNLNLLNGAQITSMLGVVNSVVEGKISRNAAISIITSTLGVSRENAEQFIEDNV